jgi:hypothetical protein
MHRPPYWPGVDVAIRKEANEVVHRPSSRFGSSVSDNGEHAQPTGVNAPGGFGLHTKDGEIGESFNVP